MFHFYSELKNLSEKLKQKKQTTEKKKTDVKKVSFNNKRLIITWPY